ncbi:uncharacterized protein LOC131998552 [Stomoxys calcitrans]|uniref:uncharacterized protein LOC131998552 n=1 Tax=Stomoxys calcitrans TaxID=35570 RepID=UPI0027E30323|nr:uncharacterized protein LOC131998552 [Stomoxys calcitrans]XP_059226980.1 uncharacterized protein LOC131998552 [Stomoxys calcitrans]
MVAENGKEPPSYARVARKHNRDELTYVVINIGCASGRFPPDHRSQVEDQVNDRIFEHVWNSVESPPIQMMSCEFRGDIFTLRFASAECIDTVKQLVRGIHAPWEGAKLDQMRKMDSIKGWGSKFATERMLGFLGKQNEGLVAEKWEVFHREEKEEGTLFVVGIDQVSVTSLAKTKGMMHYGSKAFLFKIGKTRICRNFRSATSDRAVAGDSIPPNKQGADNETITASLNIGKTRGSYDPNTKISGSAVARDPTQPKKQEPDDGPITDLKIRNNGIGKDPNTETLGSAATGVSMQPNEQGANDGTITYSQEAYLLKIWKAKIGKDPSIETSGSTGNGNPIKLNEHGPDDGTVTDFIKSRKTRLGKEPKTMLLL